MQPNDQEVQDGVATYLQNSLRTQAGLEKSWLISLARLLQAASSNLAHPLAIQVR